MDLKIKSLEKSFEGLFSKVHNIQTIINKNQSDVDKISSVFAYQQNSEDVIFNINSKLLKLTNEQNLFQKKIEDISLQNLEVVGVIGAKEKYKSLDSFISVINII